MSEHTPVAPMPGAKPAERAAMPNAPVVAPNINAPAVAPMPSVPADAPVAPMPGPANSATHIAQRLSKIEQELAKLIPVDAGEMVVREQDFDEAFVAKMADVLAQHPALLEAVAEKLSKTFSVAIDSIEAKLRKSDAPVTVFMSSLVPASESVAAPSVAAPAEAAPAAEPAPVAEPAPAAPAKPAAPAAEDKPKRSR